MALSIRDFTELMLAQLAKNSKRKKFKKLRQNYTADIPFNYRERIENILCADNGWKNKFSVLIDIDEYFEDHFFWEEKLAQEILNITKKPGNKIDFCIISEYISITINPDDVEVILNSFDEETIKIMAHFVNLLDAHIFSRRYKEDFVDYSARSTSKMHEYYEKKISSRKW